MTELTPLPDLVHDAARTARRLGAEDTLIVYRRARAQMPAHEEEAAEAEREGVRINWRGRGTRPAVADHRGFLHPDIDPERLATTAGFGLSSPADGRLPRAWIAGLAGRVSASLAGSGGVEDVADVAAYLLAGADVVMTTSALLRHRAEHALLLLGGLTDWMTRKGFTTLAEARGLLASSGWAAAAQDRAGYVRSLRAADRGERGW